ncbi:cytochrome c peroxidase [soil metagenome]
MQTNLNAAARGIRFMLAALTVSGCAHTQAWSDPQKSQLEELRLAKAPLPRDPSNRFAESEAAARLGQRFFFDTRFSANGAVSCATCHLPEKDFQDGLPLGKGIGTTGRRTMPVSGSAASPWLFWDGRKDSLWSQALGPLESGVEHGGDRVQFYRVVARVYRDDYERVFGELPRASDLPEHASPALSDERWDAWVALPARDKDAVNRVFANLGKAIAAYERKLMPGASRFDRYADAVLRGDDAGAARAMSQDEVAGLSLFIGKANCTQCHNGPRLTNDDFANTGVPDAGAKTDVGRHLCGREVLQDEFNCVGPYSDARPEQCRELHALRAGDDHALRAFKVPSLRNVAVRAPYMHAGQLATLWDVVDHYDRAPSAPAGHTELRPLHLRPDERRQLVQFLGALSAPLAVDRSWLQAPAPLPATKETAR